jgi:hypothetical protein
VPPVKLDSELVRTRIAITHQLLCSGVKILLSTADTLFERSRRALVENLQAATWPFAYLNAEQPGIFIRAARTPLKLLNSTLGAQMVPAR